MTVRPLMLADLVAVTALSRACFERPWGLQEFLSELRRPGGLCWITHEGPALASYVVARAAGDEIEILALATAPSARRRGHGQTLVTAILAAAAQVSGRTVWLEVASGNAAAVALYRRLGFRLSGSRRNYYGPGADALLLQHRPSELE